MGEPQSACAVEELLSKLPSIDAANDGEPHQSQVESMGLNPDHSCSNQGTQITTWLAD